MKIAIIGSGISGLTAAYLLHKHHDVTVYEGNDYIGGHTATIDIESKGKPLAVDTGFIVFNDWTYPNFIRLMDQIGVASRPTEMGFSVTTRHHEDLDLEYCGTDLGGLFCDRRNMANPGFLRMLWDITRFNKIATRDLESGRIPPNLPLSDYLDRCGFGRYFRDYYIYPMASAIWSAPVNRIHEFDALFFIRFFHNHGLLIIQNRPQWRVIEGGSRSYIEPLSAGFRNQVHVASPVRQVRRSESSVAVQLDHGEAQFDQVIFACHSDQALALLEKPDPQEEKSLTSIPYRSNSVVLHRDISLLPKRRKAWASWNYLLDGSQDNRPALTYNMNMLQGLRTDETICVSVNADDHIDPGKVIRRFEYDHPQFDRRSVVAQKGWEKINGVLRTWYCGAYWGNGFHEDGVVSAMRVASAIGGDSLS